MLHALPFETIKRTLLIKKEASTNPAWGGDPNQRSPDTMIEYGVVNIDKPRGPTSHQVSFFVQQILKLEKSGHSGTLDPHVTGVLPVALGRGTKVVEALLPAGKEYICIMHVHKPTDEKTLKGVFQEFTGSIKQLPPIRSSVKRQERFRTVYYLDLLEIDENQQEVLFRVGCQAGTYIRKLCHDIGQKLGCGAHMTELRRTKAGPFREDTLVTLQDLADAYWLYKEKGDASLLKKAIQSLETAVRHLPKIWVLDTCVGTLCHGIDVKVPGISKVESDIAVEDLVAVMTLKNELIALGNAKMTSKDMVENDKGLAVKIFKVFMEPGLYPKSTTTSQT